MKSLSVNVKSFRFSAENEDELTEVLVDYERNSDLLSLSSDTDLIFNSDGTVGTDGFYITNLALYQLCKLLCPSLYGFVRELSGVHKKDEHDDSDFSLDEARQIINTVIARRFDTRVNGMIMLKNFTTKTIDGIFSNQYKFLSNIQLYENTKQVIQDNNLNVKFLEAVLNGRWFMLRYINNTPCFSLHIKKDYPEDTFYSGFHFSNDELSRAFFKSAAVVYRDKTKTSCMIPFESTGIVKHIGKNFNNRLQQIINKIFSVIKDYSKLKERFLWARTREMFNKEGFNNKAKWLRSLLVKDGLPANIAAKIVEYSINNPGEDYNYAIFKNPVLARSEYDFYNAICCCATKLPINYKELTEQTAYNFITGKILYER